MLGLSCIQEAIVLYEFAEPMQRCEFIPYDVYTTRGASILDTAASWYHIQDGINAMVDRRQQIEASCGWPVVVHAPSDASVQRPSLSAADIQRRQVRDTQA